MKKREILFSITKKDLEIEYYASKGPGGQKKNKCKTSVRLKHPDSGTIVTANERRERTRNLEMAFRRLVSDPKFQAWHKRKCYEVTNDIDIEAEVEEAMKHALSEGNIKIEVKKNGKWIKHDKGNDISKEI